MSIVNSDKTQEVVADFIERLGLISQADGLPRIAGRILAVLVLHDEAFSFSQLSDKLQVSRASISTNTRLLESLSVIERTTKPGERQDYFRLRKNPYLSLVQSWQTRLQHANEVVLETKNALPEEWEGAQQRLSELADFYYQMYFATQHITDKH